MVTEFRVVLEDRPGALATLGGVLGDAGVNVQAIQGVSHAGESIVQFVPRDADKAAAALDAAPIPYTRREVLTWTGPSRWREGSPSWRSSELRREQPAHDLDQDRLRRPG